ncbi:uncharacterized protein LOC106662245 [Cimex lectularius]|uniref:Uncharacterized protein n=1 Tax=Cimex lectularius TaxID=79782 RepID=A0A8I6R9R0_CIMLE|nr:uncharacterized protein LOC106662245 [Cimex lectularius]
MSQCHDWPRMKMNECWNLDMIIDAFKKGDVHETIELHSLSNSTYLLWPKPKMEDFDFLKDALNDLEVVEVLSIGAGSGLFEWALEKISGIPVLAVELDRIYWKNTPRPNFKAHIFADEELLRCRLESGNAALLFSYFNDYKHFLRYLSLFTGSVLILIGPECHGRYSMPTPFDSNIPKEWKLWCSKEISSTKDFITVYTK